jgi:hypothetical protein
MRLTEFKFTRHVAYISFTSRPAFFLEPNGVRIDIREPLFLFSYDLEKFSLGIMDPFHSKLSISDRIGSEKRVFNMRCFEAIGCSITVKTERRNIEISSLFEQTLFFLSIGPDVNNGQISMVGMLPALR